MKRQKAKRQQATRRQPARASFSVSRVSNIASNLASNSAWQKITLSLLVVFVVTVLTSSYFWIQNPENLTIKSVEVTGDLKILDKKVLQPVIETYAKTNLYLLDTEKLEKEIENNPWVHSASMTKMWPDKLIVKVFEQKPVAFWGSKEMLAENGEIINASLNSNSEGNKSQKDFSIGNLPMLYSPGVNSSDKGRNMATGFLKIKKWMKDFPLKMVEFKEDTRGSWQIKLENGMTLKIGRDNQEKRLRRFVVGYQQSLAKVIDKISVVDLRYTNGFSVKWKKGLSADRVFKG